MSDKRYEQLLTIKRLVTRDDASPESSNDKKDSTDVNFEGIISTNALDSNFSRMGESTLKNFAKDASAGVRVLDFHDSYKLPIGGSLKGKYNKEEGTVTSEFYIQKGLSTPLSSYGNTDDFISAADRGTVKDLSVGFYDHREVCDHCGSEMRGFWFWLADENGHYPGQKIMLDEEGKETTATESPDKKLTEKIITTTIEDGRLAEFSLVTMGATPGAEILQKAVAKHEEGTLEPKHIDYISKRYRLDVRAHLATLSSSSNTSQTPPPGVGALQNPNYHASDLVEPDTIGTTGTGGGTDQKGVLSPMLNPQQEALEILRQENLSLAQERDDLLEHKRLYGEEATVKREERITELSNKVTDLEKELSQAKTERSEYNEVLKIARAEALGHYVRMKSAGLTQVDRTQTDAMLQKCRSYTIIKSHSDAWKSAADSLYRSKPASTIPIVRSKEDEDRLYNQINPYSY